MRYQDLPLVYTRLAGFMAGSMARWAGSVVPGPVLQMSRRLLSPVEPLTSALLPQALRTGYQDALSRNPAQEPPVLLVPGFLGPSILLAPLELFLRLHGRRVRLLHTFPAVTGVERVAARVAQAIDQLLLETGAAQVDLVSHSMGGLAGRYCMLNLGSASKVRRFITIATPHHGTHWARFQCLGSLRDMHPGNPLLKALQAEKPVEGVECFTIRAGWDQIIWPREHARWGSHATDHELPYAEHWAIQLDPRTLALVLELLEAPTLTQPAQTSTSPQPAPL